jgi:leader peptidase (prepilin peptidase) / N-methyltransferase
MPRRIRLKGMADLAFWAATLLLTLTLGWIAVIDQRSFRIPDWLSLPLIAIGLIGAAFLSNLALRHHLAGAIGGFLVFWAIGEWYFRRTGTEGLGLGDAKLFSAAGAWLSWQALPLVLLIASVAGLLFAVIKGRTDRTAAMPFGPALAFGFLVIWLLQAPLPPPG